MSNLLLQKNRASNGNGSWKNYSKEKTAITFGEECSFSQLHATEWISDVDGTEYQLLPICSCKNYWRRWCHYASVSRSCGAAIHYNDVIMSKMASQITGVPLFAQLLVQAQIKGNTKTPRRRSLCGELTGDRWIPRTKGPVKLIMFSFGDVIMTLGLRPSLKSPVNSLTSDIWPSS